MLRPMLFSDFSMCLLGELTGGIINAAVSGNESKIRIFQIGIVNLKS